MQDRPLWRSALNNFDFWFKVRRGREQGVVAPLLRREGPRRCYGPSRRTVASIVQQFGRITDRGTTPASNHWERGRSDDVLACTWLKKEKTSSTVSFVATGGCSRCLWISCREEAWGSLLVRPRPLQLERSSWRCTLPSYSDFLHQSALRGCADVLLPPWPLVLEFKRLDKDRPFGHACSWKSRPHTFPAVISWMRGGATTPGINRSSVWGAPATMDAVIKIASKNLRSNPPSSLRLDEVYRLFGSINRNHARHHLLLILHYRVLDCQQHRVWCGSMDEQCVVTVIYYGLYLHPLCV